MKLGTVVSIEDRPLAEEMWDELLQFMPIQDRSHRPGGPVPTTAQPPQRPATRPKPSFAALARMHDIWLDYVSFLANSRLSTHILSPRFDSMLSNEERELKEAVLQFVSSCPRSLRGSAAWDEVERFLLRLGGAQGGQRSTQQQRLSKALLANMGGPEAGPTLSKGLSAQNRTTRCVCPATLPGPRCTCVPGMMMPSPARTWLKAGRNCSMRGVGSNRQR